MSLRQPPLADEHAARGASTTEFGGWEMPVEFDSIRTEHEAVRTAAGIFDVSHMGEIEVVGPDARELTGRLTTNDVARLDPGDALYAGITDEEGILLDDTVIYRLPDRAEPTYLFVPNAGNDVAMADRWRSHRDRWGLEATVDNRTEGYAMFAVQGPDAEELVADAVGEAVREIGRFSAGYHELAGVDCLIARTGYTGEDGFELVVPVDGATAVWNAFDCQPCGLGARDTLRLEAGFLLAGQDFDAEENPRTPYEAGIGFTVSLDTAFVGRDALAAQQERGVDERIAGFRLLERGVPRHGYPILDGEGTVVGEVTSGTMSPTLGEPIGMGYLPTALTEPGTEVAVEIRGSGKTARIESRPFVGGDE